jgi:hypothetical protein
MDGADWSPHDLPSGIAYMAATGEISSARQEPTLERTLFSYYFCDGIRNWSKTETPYITPSELRKHINDQLKKNHPEDKQRAHTWTGESESDVWISLNPSYEDTTAEQQAIVTTHPFAPYDKNVDYHLRIHQEGAGYVAEILGEDRIKIPIPVSPQELAGLNKRLRSAAGDLVPQHRGETTPTDPTSIVLPLAELGRYALKRVFGSPQAFEAIEGIITSDRETHSQIISEDFLLPWNWLYPLSPDEALSFDHFWGMNHVISRLIVQDSRFETITGPAIEGTSQAKVGLIADRRLAAVAEQEIPFFERLAGDSRIELLRFRVLDRMNRVEQIRALRDFLHNAFDLLHIACHAYYDEDTPSSSFIEMRGDFLISLLDMEVYDISLNGHPLVIWNAAGADAVGPTYSAGFPAWFLRRGAKGVIAPEANLSDDFAADFAAQLYQRLLEGQSIGQSLLAARRHFWETSANPLGLLYSMFGSFSIGPVPSAESDLASTDLAPEPVWSGTVAPALVDGPSHAVSDVPIQTPPVVSDPSRLQQAQFRHLLCSYLRRAAATIVETSQLLAASEHDPHGVLRRHQEALANLRRLGDARANVLALLESFSLEQGQDLRMVAASADFKDRVAPVLDRLSKVPRIRSEFKAIESDLALAGSEIEGIVTYLWEEHDELDPT